VTLVALRDRREKEAKSHQPAKNNRGTGTTGHLEEVIPTPGATCQGSIAEDQGSQAAADRSYSLGGVHLLVLHFLPEPSMVENTQN
jgi:hypothetical protein